MKKSKRTVPSKALKVRLPTNSKEFARLVEAARTKKDRGALREVVVAEFKGRRKLWMNPQARAPQSKSLRLFEQRLIALVRVPSTTKFGRLLPAELDPAQDESLQDLVQMRSRLCVSTLHAYLRDTRKCVRQAAGGHLAGLAFDSDLPRIIRSIRCKDAVAAASAVAGAAGACANGVASARFRNRFVRELVPIVTGERRMPRTEASSTLADESVGAILSVDEQQALELFGSERCMHTRNPAICWILLGTQLYRAGSPSHVTGPFDVAMLWNIYEAARKKRIAVFEAWHRERVMGQILQLVAGADPKRALEEARQLLRELEPGYSELRDDARAVIRRCKRLPDAREALEWLEGHPGAIKGTPMQVLRASELAEHALTDGLSLYFHNIGEHWRNAAAGLKAIEQTRAEALLQQASKIISPNGLPPDVRRCQVLYNGLNADARARLDKISDRFENLAGNIVAAANSYIARHPKQFTLTEK